jgi:ABC-type glycerol-3-phosphate transport system substrate-binding protein
MQLRLYNATPLAPVTVTPVNTIVDVAATDSITVMLFLAPDSGPLVAADAVMFVKLLPDDETSWLNNEPGGAIPPVRSATDSPWANHASRVDQYDVRGVKKLAIYFRNGNAANSAFATAYVFKAAPGAVSY